MVYREQIAVGLGMAVVLLGSIAADVVGQNDWPQFRGPQFNPVVENEALPDQWSTTENVEWSVELDGRGWSSPIVVGDRVFVTTAVSDGDSKPPQVGTDYSNAYVAELQAEGLSEEEVMKKVMERDFELPDQVTLSYFLICLDLNTGAENWRQKFYEGHPPGGRHRKNSFASETPTTDGERVFVYIANLGVFAYDLEGQPIWKQALENRPIYMEFGTGASPVLCDGQLLIVNDNEESSYLAAFDTRTGKELWRTAREIKSAQPGLPKSAWVTPFVWKNSQRTEIVTMQPGTAISYDTQGNELWRLRGCTAAPAASSFSHEDVLYLNGGRGRPFFAIAPGASGTLDLRPTSATGQAAAGEANAGQDETSATSGDDAPPVDVDQYVKWSRPRAGTYIPTPVIYQGGLYILQDNGIIQRLEIANGNQSYKQRIRERGADFTTSPWAYNGKVFCLSEQGDTYVLAAGEEYELLHVNSLGEFSMASPAIVGDRLLIRTETRLYSLRSAG